MLRRELRLGQERTRALSDGSGKIAYENAAVLEQVVDRGVEPCSSADFSENSRGDPHQCTTVVRHLQDCSRPLGKRRTLRRPCQSVYSFGI